MKKIKSGLRWKHAITASITDLSIHEKENNTYYITTLFSLKVQKYWRAGCGAGSQTKITASKNPSCHFTSIDISETSIEKAKTMIQSLHIMNVVRNYFTFRNERSLSNNYYRSGDKPGKRRISYPC
jgi:tRNA G46 methylase TrmB